MNGMETKIESISRMGFGEASPIAKIVQQDLLKFGTRGNAMRPVTHSGGGMRRGLPTEVGAIGLRKWRVI